MELLELLPIIWLGLVVAAIAAILVFRLSRDVSWLMLIILLTAAAVYVSHPADLGLYYDFDGDGILEIDRTFSVRQGLDLQGGLQVLMEADVAEDQDIDDDDMNAVRLNIERRIDALGVIEPVVQRQGDRRIIVELPGIDNPDEAIDLIRETALLEFVAAGFQRLPEDAYVITSLRQEQGQTLPESVADEIVLLPGVYDTIITGADLQEVGVVTDPTTNELLVQFTLTPEGSAKFSAHTLAHQGEILAIVLDGQVISSPQIQAHIVDSGTISGNFTQETANQLVIQLRSGSLEVPLQVETITTVGPSLGAVSVERSVQAGIIGVSVVLLFMLIYYRLLGVSADIALIVFALLNFAVFKLVPITLTLPAITGFLISIGTAVDGNILIFERMKEEIRAGKKLDVAIRAGFDRAWTSIRDSNLSTMIICAILYFFGSTFGAGAVRGFAVTLALGLVINLFTAITVTRTFLHFLLPARSQWLAARQWLLGV